MTRLAATFVSLVMAAQAVVAAPQVDRLVDAMGVPALIQAFASDGVEAGQTIDRDVLNGQGGDVWDETVRRLYDPARLQADLVAAVTDALDDTTTAQALLFFESDLGARIIDLEVQARQARQDPDVEAAARAAGVQASDAVIDFLSVRDLITRNTDAALSAQTAFFAGLAATSGRSGQMPDMEDLRPAIAEDTESWLRGYYALIQSPLSADDIATYTAFWETDVGRTLDDAMFDAFAQSYASLSYGLGQAAGRLLPQNEL